MFKSVKAVKEYYYYCYSALSITLVQDSIEVNSKISAQREVAVPLGNFIALKGNHTCTSTSEIKHV